MLSLVMCGNILASLIQILMADFLLPFASYLGCFMMLSFFLVINLLILWRFEEKLDTENLARVDGLTSNYVVTENRISIKKSVMEI